MSIVFSILSIFLSIILYFFLSVLFFGLFLYSLSLVSVFINDCCNVF